MEGCHMEVHVLEHHWSVAVLTWSRAGPAQGLVSRQASLRVLEGGGGPFGWAEEEAEATNSETAGTGRATMEDLVVEGDGGRGNMEGRRGENRESRSRENKQRIERGLNEEGG